MTAENFDFERLLTDEDRTKIALGVNGDLMDGLIAGETEEGDARGAESMAVVEKLMGECNFPKYCKFYGKDPDFCDRECGVPVWEQI